MFFKDDRQNFRGDVTTTNERKGKKIFQVDGSCDELFDVRFA